MSGETWTFDKAAATWDDNAVRVKLANDVADAVEAEGILSPHMDLLEFGCGTGLLTLRLRSLVHSVTGVDGSRGMLAVLDEKIAKQGIAGVETRYLDIEQGDVLLGRYDAVVVSMTLHHIKDIPPLLKQFYDVTVPGGVLALADLDSENGEFHGRNDTVFHLGFDRADLRRMVAEAGYEDVRDRTAAHPIRPDSNGAPKSHDVFLMVGRKGV